MSLTDHIKVYPDVFSHEYCDSLITLFETSSNKGKHDVHWRRCHEYCGFDSSPLYKEFTSTIREYYNRYIKENNALSLHAANHLEAANIFRYDTGNDHHFSNHSDSWNIDTSTRQVSIIMYLNDVEEGGETTFTDLGVKVKPEKGSVLFFPSNYLFMHQGEEPVSNSKYIVVSWIHYDGSRHCYRTSKF